MEDFLYVIIPYWVGMLVVILLGQKLVLRTLDIYDYDEFLFSIVLILILEIILLYFSEYLSFLGAEALFWFIFTYTIYLISKEYFYGGKKKI